MDKFQIEIISCENGYLILEGSIFSQSNNYDRRKWVAATAEDLRDLVYKLTHGRKEDQKQPGESK